ncbi:MAG: threonine synthase [Alphaproteobacteria bacterium]|nr:threonine synthase [Alphaproteobacteria bacterium]
MKYVSTRGQSPAISFEDVLLSGPAPDGGLYMPETWPRLDFANLDGLSYTDLTAKILSLFAGAHEWNEAIARHARAAYEKFDDPRVAPLRQVDGRWLLELFHGPTLAFKDFALQLLAPLMNEALARRGQRALVVAATSGDTGAAAVAAIEDLPNVDLVVLHPKGRISDVQRRQMTTSKAANVRNVAIEGTFDDAQSLVKQLFADHAFAREHRLAAINSINWVRIVAQAAYYVSTCLALKAFRAPLTFAVPTGNFGDVFAGYVTKKIGAPVKRLIVATNANDILARAIRTGVYARGNVHATISPAMDIQVASNFERLLFAAHGRDAKTTRQLMEAFAATGTLTIQPAALGMIHDTFTTMSVDENTTANEIRLVHEAYKLLIDPHTAVAFHAGRTLEAREPVVVLATAHPAKFPDAVEKATGVKPELPERLRWILTAPERYETLPNEIGPLKAFIGRR